MDIANSFNLALDPASVWKALLDIRRIMPCIPGAELLEASDDGSTYKAKISVKLGPVALAFVGTATFAERDEATRQAKLKAKGNDSKGRGGVQADVTFQVAQAGTGSRVTVLSQVSLTGAVAQYGRGAGVIQGVASQIISQFAANLEASMAPTQAVEQRTAPTGTAPAQPVPAAKPISGFALLAKVIWNWLTGLFRQRA